ncbi:hypothetical protein QQP08_017954 [Theobroma cacao]|nr:hypothetical protein QQP08_017954 [Theobroma cacao]
MVPSTSSYSRCLHVTLGGSLAPKRCLFHTGRIDGASQPRAISPTADMNWVRPAASLMLWLRRRAKMNPPHLNRFHRWAAGQCSTTQILFEKKVKLRKMQSHQWAAGQCSTTQILFEKKVSCFANPCDSCYFRKTTESSSLLSFCLCSPIHVIEDQFLNPNL